MKSERNAVRNMNIEKPYITLKFLEMKIMSMMITGAPAIIRKGVRHRKSSFVIFSLFYFFLNIK
jgi:hypothetical protein